MSAIQAVVRPVAAGGGGQMVAFDGVLLEFYKKCDGCVLKKKRWRLLLRVIRQGSFDRGRARVWIPNLKFFAEETGLHISEVSKGLDDMERLKIVEAPRNSLGALVPGWYGINVLWLNWGVNPRKVSASAEQLWNGLEEPDDDLAQAMRQNFVRFGGQLPSTPLGTVVSPADGRPGSAEPARDSYARLPQDDRAAGPEADSIVSGAPEDLPLAPPSPSGGAPGQRLLRISTAQVRPSEGALANRPLRFSTAAVSPNAGGAAEGVVEKFSTDKARGIENPPCTPFVQRVQGVQRVPVQIKPDQRAIGSCTDARARGVENLNGARGVEKFSTAAITWSEQRRLMEVIEGWVGPEDFGINLKFWVGKVIRNFPQHVDASVFSLREQELLQPGYFKGQGHKIKVLVIDLAHRAGIARNGWQHVRPGPEPVR